MIRQALILSCASLLLAACAPKAPPPPAAGPIPKLEYEKYTLPNGLDVILVEDHRLPLVAVNLWYHVGPANERPGRTGFAHLFEHMMFQGSRHVGSDRHIQLLEAAGASEINGTTDFDRTNYFETLPSNQLELALWMESDRMGFLLDTLDQKELTGQIDVVRNERRQSIENAPYGIVEEEVFHQLFPAGHPYYASVIGSHADIEAARLEDVRGFFREYYAPNNASLAIVGDIDKAQARALVEKYFGPLAGGPKVAKPEVSTPPITAEKRVSVTDKVELPRVYMAWLSAPIYQPGDAEADLLEQAQRQAAGPQPPATGYAPQLRLGYTAGDQWEPSIATDRFGHVYVLYPQYLGVPGCPSCPSPTMTLQVSSDRGATWGTPRQIAAPGTGQWDAQIVVDPIDGRTVYASWLQDSKSDTVVARSIDFGATWQVTVADHTNAGTDKPILVAHGADVYVVFNHSQKIYAASSHDFGATFTSGVAPPKRTGHPLMV